jgi:hypothetical protein
MRRLVPIRATVLVALAPLLAIAGCASAPTAELVPFADRASDELYLGDCFSLGLALDELDLDPAERVPCDSPHDTEVVALLTEFDGTPLPPADELDLLVYPGCFERIEATIDGTLEDLPLVTSFTGDLAADGETIEGAIACLLFTRNGDILTDSAFAVAPRDLVGEWRLLSLLEPGTCFTLRAQNNLGLPGDCESDTLMFLGVVEAEAGDFPGTDALRVQRDAGCADLVPDDPRIDPATLSGTVPGLSDWLRGVRVITCDVRVI